MPFCPFCFRVPLLKLSIRKKGTLIIKGLLRNLVVESRKLEEQYLYALKVKYTVNPIKLETGLRPNSA